MIYTITLNPAIDKAVQISNFRTDEVNRITKVQNDAGGKGINVTHMAHKLKGNSIAIMITGGHTGKVLEEMIDELGLDYKSFPCEGETRINTKVFDPVRNTFTDLNEPGPAIGDEQLEAISDYLNDNLKKNDLVVMAGSIPKGVPTDIYARWIKLADNKGAKTILDASGEALTKGIEAGPFMIKPNDEELEAYFDGKFTSDRDIAECGRLLKSKGIEHVVVSQGSEGCLLISGEQIGKVSPLQLDVKSTVGAGDSMVAAIAVGIEDALAGEDALEFEQMLNIVAFGAAASSASIEQEGTIMGSVERVNELFAKITTNVWESNPIEG